MNKERIIEINSLNNKKFGLKKIIHKCDKAVCEWKHDFHIKCINDWINMCINTGEGTYPKCPTCNKYDIPLEKIPEKLKSKAQAIWQRDFIEINEVELEVEEIQEVQEVEELEFRIARRRLFDILLRNVSDQFLPFIGVIICVNGEPIIKEILLYMFQIHNIKYLYISFTQIHNINLKQLIH